MPTTVSATPLTSAETQLIDESHAHGACDSLTAQISRLQSQIAVLQARRAQADVAYRALLTKVLADKDPPLTVPPGNRVVRQLVGGVDSLLIQAP